MIEWEEQTRIDDETLVFKANFVGDPSWKMRTVWWYPLAKRARCLSCQTILRGMSANCAHAKALRRFMLRQADNRGSSAP